MEKQDAAKALFFEGASQKEIARLLKVAEKTVTKWKVDGDWEKKRTEHTLAQETANDNIWDIIQYQLSALQKKKEAYEQEGKGKLIDKGDIDALQKLYGMVKDKQQTWTSYISIIREFVNYVQTVDLDLAQRIINVSDEFLNQKRKDL